MGTSFVFAEIGPLGLTTFSSSANHCLAAAGDEGENKFFLFFSVLAGATELDKGKGGREGERESSHVVLCFLPEYDAH
jgi:hypothetical protein